MAWTDDKRAVSNTVALRTLPPPRLTVDAREKECADPYLTRPLAQGRRHHCAPRKPLESDFLTLNRLERMTHSYPSVGLVRSGALDENA